MYCPKCFKDYVRKHGGSLSPTALPSAAEKAQKKVPYCTEHGCACVEAKDVVVTLTQVCSNNGETHIVEGKYCGTHGCKTSKVEMTLEEASIIVKKYLATKMAEMDTRISRRPY